MTSSETLVLVSESSQTLKAIIKVNTPNMILVELSYVNNCAYQGRTKSPLRATEQDLLERTCTKLL